MMRSIAGGITLLVGSTLLVAAFAVKPTPAKAEIYYPWCLQVDAGDGAINCSFDSFEQCRGSLVGSGGFCFENLVYKQQQSAAPPPALQQTQQQSPPPQKKKPAPAPKPNQ
jgi:hypothetical protein